MIIDDMVLETCIMQFKFKRHELERERESVLNTRARTSVCVNCSSINSHDFFSLSIFHKITITSFSISKVTKTWPMLHKPDLTNPCQTKLTIIKKKLANALQTLVLSSDAPALSISLFVCTLNIKISTLVPKPFLQLHFNSIKTT